MYSEIWATYAAAYIRRFGAFFEESRVKTALATILPFILPVVAVAPAAALFTLGAHYFNSAIREFSSLRHTLIALQAAWVPADGLDVINLTTIIPAVSTMAAQVVDYGIWCRRAYLYTATVLLVTLFVRFRIASPEVTRLSDLGLAHAHALRRSTCLEPISRSPTSARTHPSFAVKLPSARPCAETLPCRQ